MKRVLLALLAAILLVTFTGCGKAEESPLAGDWWCKLDLTDVFNKELAEYTILGKQVQLEQFSVTIFASFETDGTYRIYADEQRTARSVQTALDEALSIAGAVTAAENLEQQVTEITEKIVTNVLREGTFRMEGDKLFSSFAPGEPLSDAVYETIEVEENRFIMTGIHGAEPKEGCEYPLTFYRSE